MSLVGVTQEKMMVELRPFGESDFGKLIAEIPDARFLLQWGVQNIPIPWMPPN